MARSPDACGPVHRKAGVAAVRFDRLTGVQPHPNLDANTVGPGMRGEGELAVDSREQRFPRAGEGDEERIALRVDLVAAVRIERPA